MIIIIVLKVNSGVNLGQGLSPKLGWPRLRNDKSGYYHIFKTQFESRSK